MTVIHRRGECDIAARGATVHRHIAGQGHRTGEGDGSIVGRDIRTQRDRTAGHRQTPQRSRAAHRTPKLHRTAAGVHRQLMAAVHRRGERDGAAVHRHIRSQNHTILECNGATLSGDIIVQRRSTAGIQNQRCTAADGQIFADCDAARRDRTARTARSGRSGGRSPDVNRARSGECADFSIAQIARRRITDRHRDSLRQRESLRRRDMDVTRSSIYAARRIYVARRIDFKPGTNQRDVTIVRCDGDSGGNRQRSVAIVAGQSGRIRLEYQTMGATAAGDVGIDGEMASRLQGQGTVRTAALDNRITYRYVSPSSQNKRCTAADGQILAYCDAARRDRTARTARTVRSGGRSPDVDRARSDEPPDFSIAQIARRCADRHRDSLRRRDIYVPCSGIYAARRIDFKPGTNQRDVTIVRFDGDTAGNLQRSVAIVVGRSGRIRLEYETMGAHGALDVSIDDEIVSRLQGQGTVPTSSPLNRGIHRNVL